MKNEQLYAVIRLRGRVSKRYDVKETLKLLRLHRKNHLVLLPNTPSYIGMLKKVKDVVTWGEVNEETLTLLFEKRGRLIGNKKITKKYLKETFKANDFKSFIKKLISGKVKLQELGQIKPVFRLHPPKGGFKRSVKKPYNDGGELGYRGLEINDLIKRMV